MSARGVCPYDCQGSRSREEEVSRSIQHTTPPTARRLKMYCVDQDPEIKDAQLKELERWSEYTVFENVPKRN